MTLIHTETFGQGKSIVLVHGWAMHSGLWRSFAKELAKNYQVTLLDLPGHGRSEVVTPFTLETVSSALVDAIPDAPCCWLGWSLGAEIVLEIAIRFPKRVDSLILLAGTPCFVQKDSWPGMDRQILNNFAESLKQDSQATLLKFLSLQIKGLADQKVIFQELKASVFESRAPDPQTLQESLIILKETDLRTVFASLSMPVFVILGELDTLVPGAVAEKMQVLMPEMDLTMIGRAGHVPFLSHQKAVVNAVRHFMDSR